jgi:thioredoxin reductase
LSQEPLILAAEVVVVGGGTAGCVAAIEAKKHEFDPNRENGNAESERVHWNGLVTMTPK